MIHKPLMTLMARVNEQLGDRVLTGLTLIMALDLFVVVPLGATQAVNIRPFSVAIVILLVSGLLIVS